MTSWLCVFEHHFNIIVGNCRFILEWENDLHTELIREVIDDLNQCISIIVSVVKRTSVCVDGV